MTCDEWNTYVQVNIYGQTIRDLREKGVVLETVLNNVGCSKLWIGEVKVYNNNNNEESSTITSSDDGLTITAPVLSTTIAEVKCPRFSTPAVPQVSLNSKFTLNLPVKLSEIHEDDDDEQEMDQDVGDVLDELIEKVTEQQEQEREISEEEEEDPEIVNPERTEQQEKAILSTTIVKTELPRASTPIRSDEAFTMNITETLSDIESNDDDAVISDQSFQQEQPEPVTKKPKRSTRTVSIMSPLNRRRSRRLSAPNLKAALETEAKEPKRKRPALKQSTTERKSSQRIQLKSSNSIHPKIAVTVRDTVKENPIEEEGSSAFETSPDLSFQSAQSTTERKPSQRIQLKSSKSINSEIPTKGGPTVFGTPPELSFQSVLSRANSFIELKPVTRFSFVAPFDFDAPSTSAQAAAAANRQNIAAPELDFDYDYDGGRQQEDTMVMGYQYEEVVGEEEGGWEGDEEEEVEKRMEFNVRASKKVSFAEPLIQNTQKDKVHLVKCYYDNCHQVFQWRIRYGKIHLVNHALTHLKQPCIPCKNCEFQSNSVSRMRYHYKRKHADVRMEGFGVLNIPFDNVNIEAIWDQCYKKQLHIVGRMPNDPNSRRKNVRRSNSKEPEEKEDEEKNAPSTSTASDDNESIDN